MHDDPPPARRPDRIGVIAALAGAIAIVFVAVPVIGDVLAAIPAVVALALGVAGVHWHETGRADRVAGSVVGALLGAIALGIVGVLAVAGLMA